MVQGFNLIVKSDSSIYRNMREMHVVIESMGFG